MKQIKSFLKKAVIWGSSVAVVASIIAFSVSTSKVVAEVPETITVEAKAPILDRIASCESKGSQIGPSGQVIIHVNTNGTYDIGKYQINSIHNAEATKLDFDLTTEEGNYGYAKYIYATKGTGDWSSSAHCWQK